MRDMCEKMEKPNLVDFSIEIKEIDSWYKKNVSIVFFTVWVDYFLNVLKY